MGTFKQKQNPFWYRLFFYALTLACIALVTTPVLAADYSGTLSQAETLTVETHNVPHAATALNQLIYRIYTNDIENYQCLTYMAVTGPYGEYTWDYAFQGASLPVSFYIGTFKMGEGTFTFNNNTATGNIAIIIQPTWWNVTYRTGTVTITMDSTDPRWAVDKLYGLRAFDDGGVGIDPITFISVNANTPCIGDYVVWNKFSFENDWDMTKSGVITTVNIYKLNKYVSRIGIYSSDNTLITQETSLNLNDYTAYIMTAPIKIAALDTLSHWHNTSYYYQNQYQVYIDPSPASTSAPSAGTISSTTSDLSEINGVYWKVDDLSFYEAGSSSKTLNYVKIGTHWYGWDTSTGNWSNDKGTTMPNPVFLNFTSSGDKVVLTQIFTTLGTTSIYTNVTVTGSPGGSLTVSAVDWSTGTLISNVEIDMLDQNHIIWYNNTAPTGKWTNPFPIGTHVRVDAKATGYQDKNPYIEGLLIDGDVSWTLKMYPIGYNVTPDIAKTTLYLNVYDGKYPTSAKVPLAGATAFARNTLGNLEIAPVPDSGSVTFILDNQTTYFMSASKTGYVTAGQYINTTTAYQYLDLYPMPVVVTGTPTITPTTVTPTPTISGYVPGTGNFTGFWAPFQNLAVAMGADPGYVGVLMALFLAFAGLVVGSIGPSMFTSTIVFNPVGGEIGALLGVAGSVAFGFFPLYIAIIVVVGLILYVSLRVYGVTR